jgi:hypothetical protein
MTDVYEALEAYRDARERMDALHEEFVHTLGRQDYSVTEARQAFDAAEEEMRHARRVWWLAVCQERLDAAD